MPGACCHSAVLPMCLTTKPAEEPGGSADNRNLTSCLSCKLASPSSEVTGTGTKDFFPSSARAPPQRALILPIGTAFPEDSCSAHSGFPLLFETCGNRLGVDELAGVPAWQARGSLLAGRAPTPAGCAGASQQSAIAWVSTA